MAGLTPMCYYINKHVTVTHRYGEAKQVRRKGNGDQHKYLCINNISVTYGHVAMLAIQLQCNIYGGQVHKH